MMNSYSDKRNLLPVLALLILLLLRVSFIGFMGLMPQDAYYFFYSEHPALSYYDHPPAVAYILWLFTAVLGKKVFVLKLAVSCITFLTLISFYFLAKRFLNKERTWYAVALFFSTFMITILSMVVTPDVPLMLFWTLSLITLYRAIFQGEKIYWLWSGILMGLAFDSKYTAIFLPAGLVLFLLLSREYRKLLLSPWFFMAILFFLISILPVVIWNWQHDFASFRFQSATRVEEGLQIDPVNFLGVIGHQAAILLPVLFFALLIFLFRVLLKRYRLRIAAIPAKELFLLCFFVPLFTGFLFISFVYWVKLNWMMPAYITGIIWISMYLAPRWVRAQVIVSVIFHLLVAVEILFYPVAVKSDDTWVGWNGLAEKIRDLREEHPGAFIFSADDYKTSAVLNFYFDEMVYGRNIIGERALQFDYIGSDLGALAGKDALFIDSQPGLAMQENNAYPPSLEKYFDSIRPLPPILIKKGGKVVREFLVFECTNYHPPMGVQ